MKTYAIILAGGVSRRMELDQNKVFLQLRDVPVIVRAIAPFTALCSGVIVVAHKDELAMMKDMLFRYSLSRVVRATVEGGDTRQQSVANGLKALPDDAELVLVHDGARPLVTENVISRVLKSVMEHGSGVAALPVSDTIKRALPTGEVTDTIDRENLYAMQTPQGFRVELLRQAHVKAAEDGYLGTDDAALLEHAGIPVFLTRGEAENIKLTTPDDIARADAILISRAERELLS